MFYVKVTVASKGVARVAVEFEFENEPSEGDVERAANAAVDAFWRFYGEGRSCEVHVQRTTANQAIEELGLLSRTEA